MTHFRHQYPPVHIVRKRIWRAYRLYFGYVCGENIISEALAKFDAFIGFLKFDKIKFHPLSLFLTYKAHCKLR